MADITSNLAQRCDLQDNAASTVVVAQTGTAGVRTNGGNTSAGAVAGPGGRFLSAQRLDGTNDKLAFGSFALIKNVGAWSAGIFFKSAANSEKVIWQVKSGAGGTDRAFFEFASVGVGAGKLRAGARAGDAEAVQVIASNSTYNDNTWRMGLVVCDYAADTLKLYDASGLVAVTGAISFTANASSNTNPTDVLIGDDSGGGFAIAMDAAGWYVWERALSAGDAAAFFDLCKPQNSVAPVISGIPKENETLTLSSQGTWSDGTTDTYDWLDGSDNVLESDAPFVADNSHVGLTVHVRLTRTNANGSTTAISNSLGPIAALDPPEITSTDSYSVAENTVASGTIETTGDLPMAITKSGGDSDLFSLTDNGDGTATWSLPAQDFDNPADDDADNVYTLPIEAANETDAADQTISVAITNVVEAGDGTDGLYPGRKGWFFARVAEGEPRRWQFLDGTQ